MARSALLVDPNNADIHFTSMALMDAIVAVRNLSMTQAIESAADRTIFDGLNLSGLVHTVLSPSALVLIRYLCLLTGEAIQVRLKLNISADLMAKSRDNAEN